MQEQGPAGAYGRGVAQISRLVGQARQGQGRRLVTDTARTVRRRAAAVAHVDDTASRLRMLRLVAGSWPGRETDRPAAGTAVPVTARAVSERPLWLRPRSRDRAAFELLDGRHHLPPPELVDPPRHIGVFGADIGLPLAELATRYPGSRLLGVEPDPEDMALARRNLAHLGGRCELVEAAVWWRDEPAGTHPVDAVDAGALIDRFTGGSALDFLFVDIGAAWSEMLRHGDWTRDVRCLKIEIHDRDDEAVPLLRGLGYRARLERQPWGAYAVGIRP